MSQIIMYPPSNDIGVDLLTKGSHGFGNTKMLHPHSTGVMVKPRLEIKMALSHQVGHELNTTREHGTARMNYKSADLCSGAQSWTVWVYAKP